VSPAQPSPTQATATRAAPAPATPAQAAPTQATPTQVAPTQAAPTQATPTRSTPRADDGGPPTAASSLARPERAGPRNTRVDGPAGLGADADLDDLEDEYDDYEDEDEVHERPTAREWAVIAAQLVVGALLGAVLWIGFSYLWQSLPVVALVLAAAATGGLVFGVRAMRRSDDLQTMVLAIVVGLVVTVSPAAFVLLAR
jgi:hypothetical protein